MQKDRILMTGNEAIARGVYESGCHVSAAYPGTPSTEIQEAVATYEGIYAEWSPNEKTALEVAGGAATAGARAFCSMKHVGLNVAADPLFTLAYTGVTGSLVINTSDEPGMHSSQNEQDNRYYARHAKVPMLMPADSQECLDYVKEAFDISHEYDTPVLFRTTTRVCHSKSLVSTGVRVEQPLIPYEKDIRRRLMIPAFSKPRHHDVEERLERLQALADTSCMNRIEPRRSPTPIPDRGTIGIITTGIAYHYAREVFADTVSYLKLGFIYPIPERRIREFAEQVDTLWIIEENEPFLEDACKRIGLDCTGKSVLPLCGELSPSIIEEAFLGVKKKRLAIRGLNDLPSRPPTLCPGCPHRGVFHGLSAYRKHVISTDIGCYTLGALPPLNAGDFLFCMGSSITGALGFARANMATPGKDTRKVFAIIGDSTFFHSGMTGLADVSYSDTPMITMILDNRITAMTGHQDNPGTGRTLSREPAKRLSIPDIVRSLGFDDDHIAVIDPHDLSAVKEALVSAVAAVGPFVIITESPCALLPEVREYGRDRTYVVDTQTCIACRACIRIGCPAISMTGPASHIDPTLCMACGDCAQVCKPHAISGPVSVSEGARHEQ